MFGLKFTLSDVTSFLMDNLNQRKKIKFRPDNVMRYAIWYHLHNLKNVKNTYGGVLILVKL